MPKNVSNLMPVIRYNNGKVLTVFGVLKEEEYYDNPNPCKEDLISYEIDCLLND